MALLKNEMFFGDRRRNHLFTWSVNKNGDWRIGYGRSNFLVAEGSSWSQPLGRAYYKQLRYKE